MRLTTQTRKLSRFLIVAAVAAVAVVVAAVAVVVAAVAVVVAAVAVVVAVVVVVVVRRVESLSLPCGSGAWEASEETALVPDPFYPDSAAFATIPRADLAAFLRPHASCILVLRLMI